VTAERLLACRTDEQYICFPWFDILVLICGNARSCVMDMSFLNDDVGWIIAK